MKNLLLWYFGINLLITLYFMYAPLKQKIKINPAGYVGAVIVNLFLGIPILALRL